MSTRLYTRNEASRINPATFKGAWDSTASQVTRRMRTVPTNVATTTVAAAETSATNNFDVLLLRLVSDPIAAQTITGTLDVMLAVLESNVAANMVYHVHAWVAQGDTDTVRGTLLTDYADSVKWPTATAGRGLATAQTVTSVAASDGDRIIIEIGYQAQNTVTTSFTGTVNYGGQPDADLVAGGSAASGLGYVQFSFNIVFKPTYLYLNNLDLLNVTIPAVRGAWDDVVSLTTHEMHTDKALSAGPTTSARAEVNVSPAWDVLLYRAISPPLAAQTISGSLDLAMGVFESSATADLVTHIHLYVMNGSDGSVRGTLLTDYIDTGGEWAITQGTSGRILQAMPVLSSVVATAGDYLVIEIGYQAQNAVTTSFTGTFIYGGGVDQAFNGLRSTDVSQGSSLSTQNSSGYVMFSNTIVFDNTAAKMRVSQVALEVITQEPSFLRVSQVALEVLIQSPPPLPMRGQTLAAL